MDAQIHQQPAQRHEGDSSMSRFTFSIPFNSTAWTRSADTTRKAPATTHSIIQMSKEEFFTPIKDDHIRRLSQTPIEQLFNTGYNPGPEKPDGSVNFECHCVSHMVASPCGHQFRKAVTCQKAVKEADMDKGECAEEFYSFLKCAMRTQCFRMPGDPGDNDGDPFEPNMDGNA
uniref:CHCH domain-containing protein n=1 Tax=Globodera rostochiensis TaxID=31243 RepID=A0A914HGP8_GLORO